MVPALSASLFAYLVQEAFASRLHILIGFTKIAGIPWIGDFPRSFGILQQKVNLLLRITAEDPQHITDIPVIHTNEVIVFVIIRCLQTDCCFTAAVYTKAVKDRPGPAVDRIADFFGAGGGRCNGELIGQAGGPDHVLHDELGHGGTAEDREHIT